ncbi:hypothetical protein KKF84_00845, partial [Myxococcota bacterium]|nr:hypothetical protein [Myxococcota bacterium]
MKYYFLFSVCLVMVTGCKKKSEPVQTTNPKPPAQTITAGAPVVLEARIVEDLGGDKYHYYTVEVVRVVKNSINVKLGSRIKVARVNTEAQPVLNRT